jgi:hypothetical protein
MAERDPVTGRFPPGRGAGLHGPRKGRGWGGQRKGAGVILDSSELAKAVVALASDPGNQAAKAAMRHLSLATWVDVAQSSDNDGSRVLAAEKIMDRIDGKAVTRTHIGGDGDAGPAVIKVVLEDLTTDAQSENP